MFTGIIEEAGVVAVVKPTRQSIALTIRADGIARGIKPGASVAVNGCCLTVVNISGRAGAKLLRFDVLQESWKRTNLQFAKAGSLVNLERPLRASGELGGHFVTGHVDGIGRIVRWEKSGVDRVLDITAPGMLDGDLDADGDLLSVSAVDTTGLAGAIVHLANGAFRFTPTNDFVGSTAFSYTVSDGNGGFDTGLVTLNVVNSAPQAGNDSYTVHAGVPLVITSPGLLGNDADFDMDALFISAWDASGLNGDLDLSADGNFSFTPTAGFTGNTGFSYTDTSAALARAEQSGLKLAIKGRVGAALVFVAFYAAVGESPLRSSTGSAP